MAMTALKMLVAAMVAALVALILWAGEPMQPSWWLLGVPFGLWIVGPAITPLVLARRFRSRPWFVDLMLAFVAVSSLVSAYAYYSAFVVSKSSTAGLVMIFMPLYQWLALVVVLLVSLGLGWRRPR